MHHNIGGRYVCVGLASLLDIEFGVFLQRQGPMEVASFLTPIDENLWIFRPVDNSHGIPSGLRIVRHEAFEVRLGNSMVSHDVIEVMLEKHLSILVLGLEVATSDGHDTLVGSVVYVAGHGGALGDAFDMVGHDPSMLEIPARLHALNQVNPTIRADLKHLENENLVHLVTMAWELIPLDKSPGADNSELGDAIHNP
jgi:hypothetical protein